MTSPTTTKRIANAATIPERTLRESDGFAPITAAPRSRLSHVEKRAISPQKPSTATIIMLVRDGPADCWKVAVSAAGHEDSISDGGALTVGPATALSGVPSTGQKLNLSANCSWQVSQNFIVTTSLSLWGLSAEFDSGAGLLIAC